MQASKISLDKIYAIEIDDELKRFHPSAVITRRTSAHGNPRDYESWVEGHIDAADRRPEEKTMIMTLQPNRLLGEWTEYKELVEREAQEKARTKAKDEAKRVAREELATLLRRVGGIEDTPSTSKYTPSSGTIIRVGYNSVDIHDEAVQPLIEALKRLIGLTTLHHMPVHS